MDQAIPPTRAVPLPKTSRSTYPASLLIPTDGPLYVFQADLHQCWNLTIMQDISARSPVLNGDSRPRQSLDSRVAYQPRTSSTFARPQPPPTQEEDFEDVGLDDGPKPKKKGFFSRMTDSSDNATGPDGRPTSSHHSFHFTGRKRGQSGQGAELGSFNKSDAPQNGGED